MRNLLVVVMLCCIPQIALAVSADEIVRIAPERLARLIELRERVIADSSHMVFSRRSVIMVDFSIPLDIHPALPGSFGARYVPATGIFRFNPKYYAALNRWIGDSPAALDSFLVAEGNLRQDIDHEIGHLLSHDIAKRRNTLDWFTPSVYQRWPKDEFIGMRILVEGVGTFAERLKTAGLPDGQLSVMPLTWDDPDWFNRFDQIMYEGGYWIVRPILQQYGEDGMVYLMTHPLKIPNGDGYQAAKDYQAQALSALGQQH